MEPDQQSQNYPDDIEEKIDIDEDTEPSPEAEEEQKPKWAVELEQKINKATAPKEPEPEIDVPPLQFEPEPQPSDAEYDFDRYKEKLSAWHERKRILEDEHAKKQAAHAEAQKLRQSVLQRYQEDKRSVSASDYDDAERRVREELDEAQQSIILQGADNPARLVYALGKNTQAMQKYARIKDPVRFAFAIASLENKMNKPRDDTPKLKPEKVVQGGGFGRSNASLESLRREADRTGDYSKVVRYKREKKRV